MQFKPWDYKLNNLKTMTNELPIQNNSHDKGSLNQTIYEFNIQAYGLMTYFVFPSASCPNGALQ